MLSPGSPKKQDMNALSVGVWNKDVGKPRVGSTSNEVSITKQQGARAFCKPEIIGGTVIFKVVDGQGAMHTFGDVKWDMGKSTLTGEVKGAICIHHDRNEFRHVTSFNLRVGKALIQDYLYKMNDPGQPADYAPLPQLKQMVLCMPQWQKMRRGAKIVHRMAKSQKARRVYQ